MGVSCFSLKNTSQTKTSSFLLIPTSLHSNACHIYWQEFLLGWFLNTFEIVFTEKIQWMNSLNCFNFVLISQKVTFHLELHVLGMAHLLAMTWASSGVCPIIMGETLYHLTSYILCFHIRDTFATHFSLHQFGVATKGDCEVVIHDIRCTMPLHLDWVVFQLHVTNTFNSMSKGVIFLKNFV